MGSRTLLFTSFIVIATVFCACGHQSTMTQLDRHFEEHFHAYKWFDTHWAKAGKNREFPYLTYDQVWNSIILVLMQKGIIVRASKELGKIVTISRPPIAIYVDKSAEVRISVIIMDGSKGNPPELAEGLAEAIRNGTNFNAVVAQYSSEGGTLDGDRGYIRRGEFGGAIDDNLFSLRKGDIAVINPPDSGRAYIVKVGDRKETIRIYVNWMVHLYNQIEDPKRNLFYYQPYQKKGITEKLFEEISTQAYSYEKWKWLRSGRKK